MKLRELLDEAIFWGGDTNKAFKRPDPMISTDPIMSEDGTYMPIDIRTKHDVQTEEECTCEPGCNCQQCENCMNEAKGMDTKTFVKAVKDEFDVETLQLMQSVIQKQITLVQKMGDIANPRTKVKGFGK